MKFKYFNGRLRDQFCISVPNFVEISQTVAEKIAIFVIFFKMAAAAILDFHKFLTVDPMPGTNIRHLAKFHQDRSNGRRYMVI